MDKVDQSIYITFKTYIGKTRLRWLLSLRNASKIFLVYGVDDFHTDTHFLDR